MIGIQMYTKEGLIVKINLSDAEWKIMNRLWESAPLTITQLTHALEGETGWKKNSIITMLSRLEGKGAIYYEEGERAKLYFPAIPREEARQAETESFLHKVYGGSLGLMMSALVDGKGLTRADIDELSEILKKAGEGK